MSPTRHAEDLLLREAPAENGPSSIKSGRHTAAPASGRRDARLLRRPGLEQRAVLGLRHQLDGDVAVTDGPGAEHQAEEQHLHNDEEQLLVGADLHYALAQPGGVVLGGRPAT